MDNASGALPFATDVHPPDVLWPGAKRSGVPHAINRAIHTGRASVMARNRIRPITDVRVLGSIWTAGCRQPPVPTPGSWPRVIGLMVWDQWRLVVTK
ncbi:hypothetical protein [Desulfoplanes formicivorans]|uniref:hypothetical protein n=1 Tax=Desulfoplanes formicivorans TaxID=1592317 RepID=UPI0008531D98|nr:hypothetical protein [Desulfoplanes formicivorans]